MNAESIDYWRILEVVGVWTAAFATYYAARTALRISKSQDEIRLRANVIHGLRMGNGLQEPILWISVTNTARRTAQLDSLTMHMSNLVKPRMLIPLETLPVRLTDGETWMQTIATGVTSVEAWYSSLAERFVDFGALRRRFEINRFRFQITCSTGEDFPIVPHPEFIRNLRSAIGKRQRGENRGLLA